ncbi:MAG TPA: NAD(P)-dependent oxidoreductase [Methylomirabilota bacterium]|nr:NAD(P)-dependent oxidoreductase [Methylomirabilota bacterium]
MHVGFVGTGNMGRPMAANVLKAGHTLTVFDLSPAATAPLEKAGATRAAGLPALASSVRVTLMSLPDAKAVEAALFGAGGAPGLMSGAKAGDFIFDLSTVGPASTRALAARTAQQGVRLVDAPVSGSVSGAEAGTLAVMIGAPEADVKAFAPIFRAIGKSLFFLGEVGKGNILKLLNNYVALTNQAALCEAMALADRLGVSRQTVGDVVGKSSGASFILERKLAALVKHDYSPGFFVDLARKDLGLGLDLMAETKGQSAVGRAAWELYGRASEAGLGKLDTCGLLGLLEPRPTP